MTARVLVVDDVAANVRLLEAKLSAEYFDVITAMNGPDALALIRSEKPDIVLLDVMMPGMNGYEVCKIVKTDPETMHIPIVMVTALDQISDRVTGLSAGADDFLTKPVDDIALFARVRSLVRIKLMIDELRLRQSTGKKLGLKDPSEIDEKTVEARILLVEDKPLMADKLLKTFPLNYHAVNEPSAEKALQLMKEKVFDLAIISLNLSGFDGLRLCSMIRSQENLRKMALLVMVDDSDHERLVRALDLGVNDYLKRPIDQNEFLARVRTQLKRQLYAEQLRKNVEMSVEYAIIDTLTGLFNRRYLDIHLKLLMEQAHQNSKPLSMCIMDLDKFKSINDTYGHDIGDEVLKEFAARVQGSIRNIDLAARMGGEEFVVVMPETPLESASIAAERIRAKIDSKPFIISREPGLLPVTVSVGISAFQSLTDTPEIIFKRADSALYHAKETGRNRVVVCRKKPKMRIV
jgi:two-component system, cell cycle response regulator